MNKLVTALHGVLASTGVGLIADALTRMHGAAQTSSSWAGVAAVAVAAVSTAVHSNTANALAHQVDVDASRVITPGVVARVKAVEDEAAKFVDVDQVASVVEARAQVIEHDLAAKIPAPAKVALEDVRPLVAEALAPVQPLLDLIAKTSGVAPAVAEPAAPAA